MHLCIDQVRCGRALRLKLFNSKHLAYFEAS